MQVIPAGLLAPSAQNPYLLTVVVRKPGRGSASATMPVFLSAEVVPEVSVWSPISGSAPGGVKLNTGSKLILDGSCALHAADARDDTAVAWSFSPPLQGSAVVSSPLSLSPAIINSRIVVPSGLGLFVPGQMYTATLQCTSPCASAGLSGGSETCRVAGTAALSVYVNQPPAGLFSFH